MNENTLNEPNYNWEQHWDEYSEAASSNPGQLYRFKFIRQLLKKYISSGKNDVIDFGSGHGDLLFSLSKEFPEVKLTGLELSEQGIKVSKQKIPTANFIQANLVNKEELKNLDKFKNKFPLGVCSEVLEHIEQEDIFLQNIHNYLSPGGLLILTVPGGLRTYFDRYIGHIRHYSKKNLINLVEKNGFEVCKFYRAGFPFFNLYKIVVYLWGKKLVKDVSNKEPSKLQFLANFVMFIFRVLFIFNLKNFSLGWQNIVVLKKSNS